MLPKAVSGSKIWNNDKSLKEKWVNLNELIAYFKTEVESSEDGSADLEIFQTLTDLFTELQTNANQQTTEKTKL